MKPNVKSAAIQTSLKYVVLLLILIGSLTACVHKFKQSDVYKILKTSQKIKRFQKSFSSQEALQLYYSADSAIQVNNLTEADRLFQEALKLDNTNPFLHARFAYFKLNTSHKDIALNHLNKAIQLKPDESEFWSARASIYALDSLIDKATSDLDKARQIDPTNATLFFVQANLSKQLGNHQDACYYADSASHYADDLFLSEKIKAFQQQNCGIQYYYHKISPYDIDPLGANLYFYNAVYDVTQTDEPHERALIAKKDAHVIRITKTGDKIMTGVKNFIKANYQFFEKEETNFLYYRENGLRHLVVNLNPHTQLDCCDIEDLFSHMKFPEDVIVIVMNGIDNGEKIF